MFEFLLGGEKKKRQPGDADNILTATIDDVNAASAAPVAPEASAAHAQATAGERKFVADQVAVLRERATATPTTAEAGSTNDPVADAMQHITVDGMDGMPAGTPQPRVEASANMPASAPANAPAASPHTPRSFGGIRPQQQHVQPLEASVPASAPATMPTLDEVRQQNAPRIPLRDEQAHLSSMRINAEQPGGAAPLTLEERLMRAQQAPANDNTENNNSAQPEIPPVPMTQPDTAASAGASADAAAPTAAWMHGMSDAMGALIDKAEKDAEQTGAPRTRLVADPVDTPALERELGEVVQELNRADTHTTPEVPSAPLMATSPAPEAPRTEAPSADAAADASTTRAGTPRAARTAATPKTQTQTHSTKPASTPAARTREKSDTPMILDTDPRVKALKEQLNNGTLTREAYHKKIQAMQQEKRAASALSTPKLQQQEKKTAHKTQEAQTPQKEEKAPASDTDTTPPAPEHALAPAPEAPSLADTTGTAEAAAVETPESRDAQHMPEMPQGIPFAQFAFPAEFQNTVRDAVRASGADIESNEVMDTLDSLADALLKGDTGKFERQRAKLEVLCADATADGAALHEKLTLLVHRELLRDAVARAQHQSAAPAAPVLRETVPPVRPEAGHGVEHAERHDAPKTAQELIDAAREVYRSRAEGADRALGQYVDASLARAEAPGEKEKEGALRAFKTILTGVALNAVAFGAAGAAVAAYTGIAGAAAVGAVAATTALTGGIAGIIVAGATLNVSLRTKKSNQS